MSEHYHLYIITISKEHTANLAAIQAFYFHKTIFILKMTTLEQRNKAVITKYFEEY